MPINNTTPTTAFPVWSTDQAGGPTRYAPLPTVQKIKDGPLFGIPLRSALTGQTVSDDTIQDYINQAISQLEHELDMYVTPVTFMEKHDYVRDMFAFSFAYLKLYHPNIISVSAVQISFNNDSNIPAVITFPLEHVHVMPQEGMIELVPAYGTSLSGFLLSAFSGVQYHAFNAAMLQNWPGAIRVTYTAGFQPDQIPAAISGVISRKAAYSFLSILGPILFPVSSTSVGIDGVSQSVGTPGPRFLQLRMEELDKQIQQEMAVLRGHYQRGVLIDYI